MLKLRRSTLILLSGIVMFCIGVFLLRMGLNLVVNHAKEPLAAPSSLFYPLHFLSPNKEMVASFIIALALIVGYLKGKYVLAKTAHKGSQRILALPDPSPLHHIYSKGYYLLMAGMMGLGVLMNVLDVPKDIRGFIDAAIGAALIQGSVVYFKMLSSLKKT